MLHPVLLSMKGSSDVLQECKACSEAVCNPCSALKILFSGQANLLTADFGEKTLFVDVL